MKVQDEFASNKLLYSLSFTLYSFLLLVHLSLVHYADGLALADRQRAFRHEFDDWGEQDLVFELAGHLFAERLQTTIIVGEEFLQFDFDGHVVVILVGG